MVLVDRASVDRNSNKNKGFCVAVMKGPASTEEMEGSRDPVIPLVETPLSHHVIRDAADDQSMTTKFAG